MDEDAYQKQLWCDCGHEAAVKVTVTDLEGSVLEKVELCQCCAEQELSTDTFQLGKLPSCGVDASTVD